MKSFLIFAGCLLVSTCSASLYGAVSTQYQHLGHDHTYSYGYADPNSQKHESRAHDGVTRGSYSYVDGHGHVQSISYVADPHHGFNAVGTNLPKGPDAHAHAAHVPYAAAHAYAPYHHAVAHHVPVLTHAGVPVDTPEVQHARAAHLAAHAAASHDHHGSHHLYKRSLYAHQAWAHAAPALHGGAPIDTPEVQHAKAAHFAAHAAARSGHAGGHLIAAHGHHVPVIHNGVPVDTPEVQHAKAAHYAAVAEASSRSGGAGHHYDDGHYDGGHYDGGHYDGGHYDGRWDGHSGSYDHGHGGATHYATHAVHSGHDHGYGAGYKGPIHIPVIHNGVPVEPAEVQHARAAHLNALAAASHGSGYHHGGHY